MRLKDYLRIYNIKVKDFAEKLGYTRPHLYDVMRGRYQAGRLLIEAVEKETNGIVKKEDWVNGKPFDPNQLLFKFMEDNHD